MIGWIAIYRCITEHWIWNTSSRRFQRWVDLLFLASWKDRKVGFGNTIVHLERGQIVTSVRQLMSRWRTNNSTVTATLKLFEDNGMIICERGRNMTVITVVNYNKYQRFATLAQSLADEQDMMAELIDENDENLHQKEPKERHKWVQNQIPIEQDNNIINNNKQKNVVDDARAKSFFDDFISREKVKKGCSLLEINEKLYVELVSKVIDEWQFTEETDWSFKHLINHLRRKLKSQQSNTNNNGKSTGIANQVNRGNDGESPFSRATIHREQSDR